MARQTCSLRMSDPVPVTHHQLGLTLTRALIDVNVQAGDSQLSPTCAALEMSWNR